MAYIYKDYSSFILHVDYRSAEVTAQAASVFHLFLHSGIQAKGEASMWILYASMVDGGKKIFTEHALILKVLLVFTSTSSNVDVQ